MHYQVSLNQNIIKELADFEGMQDPVEIDGHIVEDSLKAPEIVEKVYFSRYSSISPPRDNDAQNKNIIKKGANKDRSVSPCNSIEILDKVLQNRFSVKPIQQENSAIKKPILSDQNIRRKSVSPYRSISPMSTSPLQNVKNLFVGFCNNYNKTQQTTPKSYTTKRVQAQFKYMQTIRKNTFQSQFVKKLIFSAWKIYIKENLDKSFNN